MKLKKFILGSKGSAPVEFVLTIVFYLFAVCLILEFCRIAITTSYWDLAITESVRVSKAEYNGEGDYLNVFKNNLQKQLKSQENSTLGNFLQLDKNNGYNVEVKYVDCSQGKSCINALLNGNFKKIPGGTPDGKGASLAYYKVVYKYKFLVPVPFISSSLLEHVLSREFVTVQEWHRSQFPVTP